MSSPKGMGNTHFVLEIGVLEAFMSMKAMVEELYQERKGLAKGGPSMKDEEGKASK